MYTYHISHISPYICTYTTLEALDPREGVWRLPGLGGYMYVYIYIYTYYTNNDNNNDNHTNKKQQ